MLFKKQWKKLSAKATPKRKENESWVSYQQRNAKRNRCLAEVFVVLAFLLLFAVVIRSIIEFEEDEVPEFIKPMPIDQALHTRTLSKGVTNVLSGDLSCCSLTSSCTVTCANCHVRYLVAAVNNSTQDDTCQSYNVEVQKCTFKEQKIFVNDLEFNASISKLTLTNNPITQVEANAFNLTCFANLRYLAINAHKIATLTSGMLTGLASLTEFVLTDCPIVRIETGFLSPSKSSLVQLQVQSLPYAVSLAHLTGDASLSVQIVDLRFNALDTLDKFSFKGLISVITLYLSSSKIRAIGPGTFDAIVKTIQLIDLRNNNLVSLPPKIFENLMTKTRMRLDIAQNPWHCDCALKELKRCINEKPSFFPGDVVCETPVDNKDELIQDAELCIVATTQSATTTDETDFITDQENVTENKTPTGNYLTRSTDDYQIITTNSTGSTIKATETTTAMTKPSDTLVNVQCDLNLNFSNADVETKPTQSSSRLYYFSIFIKMGDAELQIKDLSPGSVLVEASSTNDNFVLIWFAEFNHTIRSRPLDISSFMGCAARTYSQMRISDLSENTAYTFCLVERPHPTISPLNCASHFMHSRVIQSNVWLDKDDKALTIGLLVTGLMVSLVLGGITMYILMKRKTDLLIQNGKLNGDKSDSDDVKPEKNNNHWVEDDSYYETAVERNEIPGYAEPRNVHGYINPAVINVYESKWGDVKRLPIRVVSQELPDIPTPDTDFPPPLPPCPPRNRSYVERETPNGIRLLASDVDGRYPRHEHLYATLD